MGLFDKVKSFFKKNQQNNEAINSFVEDDDKGNSFDSVSYTEDVKELFPLKDVNKRQSNYDIEAFRKDLGLDLSDLKIFQNIENLTGKEDDLYNEGEWVRSCHGVDDDMLE